MLRFILSLNTIKFLTQRKGRTSRRYDLELHSTVYNIHGLIIRRSRQLRLSQASFISVLLSFCCFFQHCLKFSSYDLTYVSIFLVAFAWESKSAMLSRADYRTSA
jgi:hypothetical protein